MKSEVLAIEQSKNQFELFSDSVLLARPVHGRDGWVNQLSGAHRHVGEDRPQPLHLQRVPAEGPEDNGHGQP